MIEVWEDKQVNQVLCCHVTSSTLAVRTASQSRNTTVECPDTSFQSNQAVDDSLTIGIVEVTGEPFRGEAALLDEIVYKPTDGSCMTGYQNPSTNIG